MDVIRNIKALDSAGFKISRIAKDAGLHFTSLNKIVEDKCSSVRAETEEKLQAVFMSLGQQLKEISEMLLEGKEKAPAVLVTPSPIDKKNKKVAPIESKAAHADYKKEG